ncbi:hypothetical protein EPA93_10545 [Ktedonosporobacter rubrisoli]|uniref:Uncharacterized protein n=1 Tax=Ktedonosporobacter rubrisoli TaxID=2509675 RepID=A0A4P6JMH0_KTERU|nr:hypothetical protein [Ktedonosporobacter rubrisoli]QBD76424.1 hypothetical protein EPA93_10545 [Ktedonosporobacter rubrisoli]
MDFEQGYRLTRQAWIDGVNEFHPTPKESYTLAWEKMPSWEQEAVKSLYHAVRDILLPSLQQGVRIPREHGGYLVSAIWNVLMFQLLHTPKPSYVKHFDELEKWQQKTDIKMFEAIESAMLQELTKL